MMYTTEIPGQAKIITMDFLVNFRSFIKVTLHSQGYIYKVSDIEYTYLDDNGQTETEDQTNKMHVDSLTKLTGIQFEEVDDE